MQDQKALEKIVSAADLQANDKILEIGPGKGALTKELINKFENERSYERRYLRSWKFVSTSILTLIGKYYKYSHKLPLNN